MKTYDKIIIGAGFYGLYAALFCCRLGQRVLVLEFDNEPFSRATFVNQARIHNGYHYPRSYSTAIKSVRYFNRFINDYEFCIYSNFEKIYGISARHSWTNAAEFEHFCNSAGIYYLPVSPEAYFTPHLCERAFITKEYTYDAQLLKKHLLAELERNPLVEMRCRARINGVRRLARHYEVIDEAGNAHLAPFLLNATYASINQILSLVDEKPFNIKYELCEIIICDTTDKLKNTGITVMDGPFFSIMPFGKTGQHSLTSVTFTPHQTCRTEKPSFSCQSSSAICGPDQFNNCNLCECKPDSAWPYMSALARKYLRRDFSFTYSDSYFSIKPILVTSEIDDSRPTVIVQHTDSPTLVSVLSGKINTGASHLCYPVSGCNVVLFSG